MKKQIFITLLLGLLLAGLATNAQQPQHFPDLHPDSVMRQEQRMAQMQFVPGEVLVRFKDELNINVFKSNGKAQTGLASTDALFNEFGVLEAKKLIPNAQPLPQKQILHAPTGRDFERPSLHNIYHLKVSSEDYRMFELIEALKEDKNILYAEPNYIYNLTDHETLSPVLTAEDLAVMYPSQQLPDNNLKDGKATIVPNDPYYGQQWWIGAINADLAWETSTGDANQVIAILDTGVDWQHPDLINKTWTNPGESLNNADSDGNGFTDDIRGWDFINNENNPMDDNSHGTHVAGIAGAEANNGIGIAGVSWGARIMPVKVLQSSGSGNAATIVKGINYAANNGATVINMSFGSYARSLAMEDALANAYATTVLVATAGNDGTPIRIAQMFPAALSFVLGIQASQVMPDLCGYRACWSNYDQDGPVYSNWPELLNYELLVPGSQLISAIPGGNYRVYSGTSMAAPIIAGSVALYRSLYPEKSQEIMWSDMINSSLGVFDLQATLNGFDESVLSFVSHTLVDTLGGDEDGRPDAGESIELWYKLRNTGVHADSVYAGIRLGSFEDTTTVRILVPTAFIGSISPYATRTNEINPLVIKIDPNTVHDRHIILESWTTFFPYYDTTWQITILVVENGVELQGVIMDTLVLSANRIWLINESFKIGNTGVLIMQEGSRLIANKHFIVDGVINALGSQTKKISITGKSMKGTGRLSLKHTNVVLRPDISNYYTAIWDLPIIFENCELNFTGSTGIYGSGRIDLVNSDFVFNGTHVGTNPKLYSTKTNFRINAYEAFDFMLNSNNNFISLKFNNLRKKINPATFVECNVLERDPSIGSMSGYYYTLPSNIYFGTIDSTIISKIIYDFYDDPNLALIDFVTNLVSVPFEKNQAIVWKVLVNGADAQDEFVEPVGVGQQRFDVYFNRPMDISFTPMVTFGVRAPYTQQAVNENSSWSADSTIYTVYKTIQLYTGDGINRIRVTGARDPELFEIPIEDRRFNFLIDAAGSASTDFMASPGMGKVDLEWTHPEAVEDLLGYNLYRFKHITDTTFTNPILLNTTLVLDTLYTDFEVLPGTKYYYYYKILRTNLVETDSSRVVNGIPHTAALGDANGDYNVNILDITSIVAYILNGTPQPFIFEAADINADGQINLLDVIGVVNIIMNGNKSGVLSKPATVYLNDEHAEIKSDGTMAGLQFQLIGKNIEQLELKNLPKGFEFIRMINGDTLTGILFNMQNNTLPEGRINLFDITLHPGTLEWGEVFGGNYLGKYIPVFTSEDALPVDHRYSFNVYPNPAMEHFVSDIQLPSKSEVQLQIFDMYGRSIKLMDKAIIDSGRHQFRFDKQQLPALKGLYILQLKIRPLDKNELPFRKEVKIMIL